MKTVTDFYGDSAQLKDTIKAQMPALFPQVVAEKYGDSYLFNEFFDMLTTLNNLFANRMQAVKQYDHAIEASLVNELQSILGIYLDELSENDARQIVAVFTEIEYLLRTKGTLLAIFKLLELLDMQVDSVVTYMIDLQTNKIIEAQRYSLEYLYKNYYTFTNEFIERKVSAPGNKHYSIIEHRYATIAMYRINVVSDIDANSGYYVDPVPANVFKALLNKILTIESDTVINIVFDFDELNSSYTGDGHIEVEVVNSVTTDDWVTHTDTYIIPGYAFIHDYPIDVFKQETVYDVHNTIYTNSATYTFDTTTQHFSYDSTAVTLLTSAHAAPGIFIIREEQFWTVT